MKYTASQYWQHRLIPWVICFRVYGKAHAFILDRHALIETQRAAGQGAGFNGLAIGRGGGIPHALTRFSCGAVINILIGIGVLQHCLPVVEADDAVWRVQGADLSLAINVTARQQQDRTGDEDSFHGSL